MTTSLGDYLKELRGTRSQTEVAEAAGVQRAHLSEIERGKIAFPNADIRRRLAKALGVSHLDLLVAAGEITESELVVSQGPGEPSAHLREERPVYGRIERDPDDPREDLISRIRALPHMERIDWALDFAVTSLEQELGTRKDRGR